MIFKWYLNNRDYQKTAQTSDTAT